MSVGAGVRVELRDLTRTYGNVNALDVLRAMTREPESIAAFDAEINLARGADPVLDAHLDRVRTELGQFVDWVGGDGAAARARWELSPRGSGPRGRSPP